MHVESWRADFGSDDQSMETSPADGVSNALNAVDAEVEMLACPEIGELAVACSFFGKQAGVRRGMSERTLYCRSLVPTLQG